MLRSLPLKSRNLTPVRRYYRELHSEGELDMWHPIVKRTIRCLNFILFLFAWPIYKLHELRFKRKTVPPIKNKLLLHSAVELADMIRNRKVSALEVMQAFIGRICEVDPVINSVVDERYKHALDDSMAADEAIKNNPDPAYWAAHKPLLGVPITFKECIAVAGLSNNTGRSAPSCLIAVKDAVVTANLKTAGAIPVVVSNTPELCLFWETYNYANGHTNNPFDTRKTAGGSSGGEAALLATGASVIGIGSDICGSGRLPPHYCGVFGHKPSSKIMNLQGHLPTSEDPEWTTFLTIAPMTRYACDLPVLIKAAAPHSSKVLDLDNPVDVKQLKIFYMEEMKSHLLQSVDPEIKEAVKRSAFYFQNAYNITPEKVSIKGFDDALEAGSALMLQMSVIENCIEKSGEKIAWNCKRIAIECLKKLVFMSHYQWYTIGYNVLQQIGSLISRKRILKYRELKVNLTKQFEDLLGDNGVLILPVFVDVADKHFSTYTKALSTGYMSAFNFLEMPATSVPICFNRDGLPIGVQVVSLKNHDRLTLAVAQELEKGFGGWLRQVDKNDNDS